MTITISMRCKKTEAGRAEIRTRNLPLSRSARTLLLIIDGSRLAVEWLALVQGATQADLDALISNGLLEVQAEGGTKSDSGSKDSGKNSVPPPAQDDELSEAFNSLTYGELYTLLTDQARARFGLIKGYRLVLEVEKCTDLPGLQALGQRFLKQVRDEQGDAGLSEIRKALGV